MPQNTVRHIQVGYDDVDIQHVSIYDISSASSVWTVPQERRLRFVLKNGEAIFSNSKAGRPADIQLVYTST